MEDYVQEFFFGNVTIEVFDDFSAASLYSYTENGDMNTANRLQFHLPTDEFGCAGLCQSDDNFNNVCDEYEGCMDVTACNYNPDATYDLSNCVAGWNCQGCMDTTA